MTASRCTAPLGPAVLSDYWLAELTSEEEEVVEDHLLACEQCSRELQGVIELADAIRALTRKGLLRVCVSGEFLERLEKEGLHIRQYHVVPGGSVACTITDQDDLVVARLAADLAGAQRVDLSRCDAEGHEVARLCDIPLTRLRNEIAWTEPSDFLRALGKEVVHVRVLAVDKAGERVLGEYTFDHTPSRPSQ